MLRPVIWLFILWIAGDFPFENTPVLNDAPMTAGKALGFSAANLLPFLPLKRELVTAAGADSFFGQFHLIASFQSIGGLVLLFLLGLALKNQFRMR